MSSLAVGHVPRLNGSVADSALDEVFRREWPRILAAVIRYTGSLELAEEAVQESFARAVASRDRELLINPAAWITTVAKRIAIDTVRRDAALRRRLPLLAADLEQQPAPVRRTAIESSVGDDRLALLFVACSPALAPETRLALALRFVCGVGTADIADAMLVSHTAMSARLTRAKRQLERGGIRLAGRDVAAPEDFLGPDVAEPGHSDRGRAESGRAEPSRSGAGRSGAGRLDDVLGTVHLLYTVGHTAFAGETVGSRSVATTAIELARSLRLFAPDDLEVEGLLALLLLTDARTPTRVDDSGNLVPLDEADRSAWNPDLIREGLDLAAHALPGGGRFALQAGISGLHSQAPTWEATDWAAICLLYDRLIEQWPSPSARIARIAARGFSRLGPAAALAELDELGPSLAGAAARQAIAVRADLLRRLGRTADARAAYIQARSHELNTPLKVFYGRRIGELDGGELDRDSARPR